MGGGYIECADFVGEDKSGGPAVAVLSEGFRRAFGRSPRIPKRESFFQRILPAIFRPKLPHSSTETGLEFLAEGALARLPIDQRCDISSELAAHLLPYVRQYQTEVLNRLGIPNDIDQISDHLDGSTEAKYGLKHDDGWHAYCLHDMILAFEKSCDTGEPVVLSLD